MKHSQLAVILRSFTKAEFKEFSRFLRSPYFNNRDEVTRFYDALKGFYPLFNSKNLTEENIFSKVYPKKKFSSVLMRKLVSLIIQQAMNFFTVSSFKENVLEFNVKMLDKLREKKLDTMFEKKIRNIEELFGKSKQDFAFYESKYKYTSILNGYYLNVNEKTMVNKFQNELDDFIEYYLGVSLLMYLRLSEWGRMYSIKFDMKFYNEVINYLSVSEFKNITISQIYFNMLMLLNSGEEKYFFTLQDLRDKFEDKLSGIDDFNIGVVSIQYCYKRVLKGDTEYRRHQFNITNKILDKNLIPAGYVDPYFFTNAVRNASAIKELEWAEKFINNYKQKLNPDNSEEITDYSLALVEFSRKNYERSLKHLSKINLEMSGMKLEIKNLLVVIYYELSYTEELISLIDTYKHFLHRDKNMSNQSRQTSTLFLNFVSELHKIKLSRKSGYPLKIKREIEAGPYSNLKEWLLEKANELI